ncbi:MAG TPA: protein-export chaperone SecB, partial [Sphingobium sp.]
LAARYVGAGFASDAFNGVAFRLPNMFRALFAEGAFSAAFIPMFNRKVGEKGELAAGLAFAEAPRLLFPFARRVLADAIRDGGFPPLLLDPIDFGGLYVQQAQALAQTTGEPAGNA